MIKDLKIKHLKEKVAFQAEQIRRLEAAILELGRTCGELRRQLHERRNGK